jgi:hypothetical protein
VTEHWSDKLGVTGHADWPGMSSPESESGESGLVGVLVARDTGSTVVACGFLVDVFCLGVKNTNGPKTIDRRQAPGLHPDVLQRVVQQASRPGTAGTSPAYRVRSGGLRAKPGLRTPSRLRQGRRASRRLGGRQQRRHVRPGRKRSTSTARATTPTASWRSCGRRSATGTSTTSSNSQAPLR